MTNQKPDGIERARAGLIPIWCAFDDVIALDRLKPHPKKNNVHPDRQIELLSRIIMVTGWRAPITVSTLSGHVTKGHGKLAAAIFAGFGSAPVEFQHYEDEAAEISDLLADNKIAELSYLDEEETKALLIDLKEYGADFELAGFELSEVDRILTFGTRGKTDPDEIPEIDETEPPITNPGDIWELGGHKLICADATCPNAASKLMDGAMAAMVFTDPPYNVDYAGGTKAHLKIKNDNMKSVQFGSLIRRALFNMRNHATPGGPIYICHADKEWRAFRGGMEDAGWMLKQCLIWEKNQFVIGRQDYHWRHEPILYGWNPGSGHKWHGGRKQDTVINLPDGVLVEEKSDGSAMITIDIGLQRVVFYVSGFEILFSGDDSMQSIWKIEKPLKSEEHPTMKPVALVERAIRNSSLPGEIVIDWFCGSGSTLIACEITGRRARVMELDPHYCDVIVARWENFTGRQSARVCNG